MKIRGTFCERVETPLTKIDRRSLRWIKRGKAWIRVGCPKGKWKTRAERCAVGTRANVVLKPTRGACAVGRRIRK